MTVSRGQFNLIICGVGGQGNIVISRLIGRAAIKNGYFVTLSESFGAAQRGGAVTSEIIVSQKQAHGLIIPRGKAHVILGLEPMETLRTLVKYGNPDVVTVTNSYPVRPIEVIIGQSEYPDLQEIKNTVQRLSRLSCVIDATQLALELGTPVIANVIMVGALLAYNELPFTAQDIEDLIKDTFPPDRVELNLKAFKEGRRIAAGSFKEIKKLRRKEHA